MSAYRKNPLTMFLVFLRSSGTRHYVKVLRALRFPVTLVPSQSVRMAAPMFLGLSLCVFGYNRAYHLPSSVGETRTKSDQTNLELQLDASELNEIDFV